MNVNTAAGCPGSVTPIKTEEHDSNTRQGLPGTQSTLEGTPPEQQDIGKPEGTPPEQQDMDKSDGDEEKAQGGTGVGADPGFNNEKMQRWITLGAALGFLGEQKDVDSIPVAFWDTYRSVVDKATALDLVYAVSLLPAESLKTALLGIRILSDYRYGCKTPPGAIPALYAEFLIRYQSISDINKNFETCSIGLYAIIMKECGYGVEKTSDSLGTGNTRIYSAFNALATNGLVLDFDRINAPGAGRDDIDTVFLHDILPEVIAAKIKKEELEFRKTLKELEELAIHGVGSGEKPPEEGESPSNDTHIGAPVPGDGTPQGQNQYKQPCEAREIDLLKLRDDVLAALNGALDILNLALGGKKMDFNLLKLKTRLEEDGETVKNYYVLACPEEGEAGMVSFNLAPAFVEFCDTLHRRCDAIIQVKAENEDVFDEEKDGNPETIAYRRRKLLNSVVTRKWFLQGLADEEFRYARICELLKEVASRMAAVEAASQEEGEESDAERAKRYQENLAQALSNLEAVIKKIEAALKNTTKGTKFYQKAEETATL